MLRGWLAGGGRRDVQARGHDESELLRRTAAEKAAARERTFRLVDGFLDRIATSTITTRAKLSDPANAPSAVGEVTTTEGR